MWWERRREGEATPAYLARVLDDVGLTEMAADARACHYDDFLCPPDVDDGMNIHRLVAELRLAQTKASGLDRERIEAIVAAAINGEFDATREESAAWERSPDGQEALRMLAEGQ
jgi:hypothetical protein